MRNRHSREMLHHLQRVDKVNPPMPPDDGSDSEWDAWADSQDLQASLVGLMSRGRDDAVTLDDPHGLRAVRLLLSQPAVIALLGDAADDARALVAGLDKSADS